MSMREEILACPLSAANGNDHTKTLIVVGPPEVKIKHTGCITGCRSSMANTARLHKTQTIRLLLERGADANKFGSNGNAIFFAIGGGVKKDTIEICNLFLESGADPQAQSPMGTALH